jgi:hypothetical protein
LNILEGVGYLLVGIGVLVLFVGVFVGFTAVRVISQVPYVGEQLGLTVFAAALTPYGVASGVFFALGVGAIYFGTRKPIDVAVSQTVNVSTPYEHNRQEGYTVAKPSSTGQKISSVAVSDDVLPLPKQAVCPSCESPIILVEEYQRWYCVNEKKYI